MRPNPEKDLERFNRWLDILDMQDLRLMDMHKVYTNKCVCSVHFDSQFKSPGNSKLHSNASPTLQLSVATVDISDNALEESKCSGCEDLFQSPVYLHHDGASQRGSNTHEEERDHHQYVCPVLGSSHCDWRGPRGGILQHCQAQHPDRVLDSPCTLTHDISGPSVNTYLLRGLQVLFLLHTKVCVVTGKLHHVVRYLGPSDEAADFSYTLDIKRGDVQLSLKGQVAEQGCLEIQEPTSLVLDMRSLLSVLGGLDGATFTVAVKGLLREMCPRCGVQLTALLYRDKEGWQCERCAPSTCSCRNQEHGCQHRDIKMKCYKHEQYFCEHGTRCYVCSVDVPRGEILSHYSSAHSDATYKAGATWRATRTDTSGRWCLVSSAAGTTVCRYWLWDTQFRIWVLAPISSDRLIEFRCLVRLIDPATGHAHSFPLEARYDDWRDWNIEVQKAELSTWSDRLDVCVEIIKI